MKILIDTFFGLDKHIVALVEFLNTDSFNLNTYKVIKHISGDLDRIKFFKNNKPYSELEYINNKIYIDSNIVDNYIFDLTNEHKLKYL